MKLELILLTKFSPEDVQGECQFTKVTILCGDPETLNTSQEFRADLDQKLLLVPKRFLL